MADSENSDDKRIGENVIHMLFSSARSITVYANNIKRVVEIILTSCHTQGANGDSHKIVLLSMAHAMKKLAGGVPEDMVLPELISYNIFFGDQIKSE